MECLFYFSDAGCTFDSDATASWLQFLGSMVALSIAIYLPEFNRRRERKAHFTAAIEGITVLMSRLRTLTGNLPNVIDNERTNNGQISQIQYGYEDAVNAICKQIDAIGIFDVHDPQVLVILSLLKFGAKQGTKEIVENWPVLESDFGTVTVKDSVDALIKLIDLVQKQLDDLPRP